MIVNTEKEILESMINIAKEGIPIDVKFNDSELKNLREAHNSNLEKMIDRKIALHLT